MATYFSSGKVAFAALVAFAAHVSLILMNLH